MSTRQLSPLRKLARAHYHGSLSRERYVEYRTLLLQSIMDGTPPPNIELDTVEHTAIAGTPRRRPAQPPTPPPPAAHHTWLVISSIAMAVVIIALLWVIFSGKDEAPAPSMAQPEQIRTLAGEMDQHIATFINANQWDASARSSLLMKWYELPDSEQNKVTQGAPFQRFTRITKDQIARNKGTDTLELMAFANRMGIEVEPPPEALSQATEPVDISPDVSASPTPPTPELELATQLPEPTREEQVTDQQPAATQQVKPAAKPDEAVVATSKDQPQQAPAPKATQTKPQPKTTQQPAVDTRPKQAPAPKAAQTKPQPKTTKQPAAKPKQAPAPKKQPAAASDDQASPIPASKAAQPKQPAKIVDKTGCWEGLIGTRKRFCRDRLPNGASGPTMVILRPGTFMMGSEQRPEESPVHSVNINYTIAFSSHEITQAEYDLFCNTTGRACPARAWPADGHPVVGVSWEDASAYAQWLAEATGKKYRLPSESEWEYAARAGSTTPYASSLGGKIVLSDARFSYVKEQTSPLPKSNRTVNKNKFSLYHMPGNVREWVADAWRDSYEGAPDNGSAINGGVRTDRVVRGGSYADQMDMLRSAARIKLGQESRDAYTGIRVVLEFPRR